jgi:ribosomal protein S18 acetylase RimI-like enzyme
MNFYELRRKLRRKGLVGSVRFLFEHGVFAHRQLLWFDRELSGHLLTVPRRHAWQYVDIQPDLLPAFHSHFPHKQAVIRDLLAQPDLHGYAALNPRGEVCAYLWISPRDYHDTHYYQGWFAVNPGDAYLFALEIASEHRGSALFFGGQDLVWQLLQQRGYHRALAVVDVRNQLMLSLIERLGFCADGRIVHVYTLFGWLRFSRQTRASGACRTALRRRRYAPAE